MMEITIMERSVIVIPFNVIGLITPVRPRIARILNTFEPSTLPIAIPLFPLRADTTLVASSGREVPPATIVRPITASDTPSFVATAVAPSTNRLLPPIKHASPTRIHTTDSQVAIGFFSFSSKSVPCAFAPRSVIYIKIRNITKRIAASILLISGQS